MIFDISGHYQHIFILGAGASVDYGLPVWRDLGPLIAERIKKDVEDKYSYKKEMLAWISKVGGEYSTIDECILKESASKEYHDNGPEIENQIFLIIKDILTEAYKEPEIGWIRMLNDKILHSRRLALEKKIAFINYNYDDILEKSFLRFDYLPRKHQIFNHKSSLDELSTVYTPVLYPHGTLFDGETSGTHLSKRTQTMKTPHSEYVDVVSCYESDRHIIQKNYGERELKLYILGLGGGMRINLDNILLSHPVIEIHVTIKDKAIEKEVTNYLSNKYKIPVPDIRIYESCDDLIQNCFGTLVGVPSPAAVTAV